MAAISHGIFLCSHTEPSELRALLCKTLRQIRRVRKICENVQPKIRSYLPQKAPKHIVQTLPRKIAKNILQPLRRKTKNQQTRRNEPQRGGRRHTTGFSKRKHAVMRPMSTIFESLKKKPSCPLLGRKRKNIRLELKWTRGRTIKHSRPIFINKKRLNSQKDLS